MHDSTGKNTSLKSRLGIHGYQVPSINCNVQDYVMNSPQMILWLSRPGSRYGCNISNHTYSENKCVITVKQGHTGGRVCGNGLVSANGQNTSIL